MLRDTVLLSVPPILFESICISSKLLCTLGAVSHCLANLHSGIRTLTNYRCATLLVKLPVDAPPPPTFQVNQYRYRYYSRRYF
jgi:hypothetical protein